ncbi:hypothetical protein STEG23_014102, partial [Scotinomys teguina]
MASELCRPTAPEFEACPGVPWSDAALDLVFVFFCELVKTIHYYLMFEREACFNPTLLFGNVEAAMAPGSCSSVCRYSALDVILEGCVLWTAEQAVPMVVHTKWLRDCGVRWDRLRGEKPSGYRLHQLYYVCVYVCDIRLAFTPEPSIDLSYLSHCFNKIQDKSDLRKKGLFWLMVPENAVCISQ